METDDCIVKLFPPSLRPYVVLTGGVICMTSLSVVYSFGNLLPYLVSYLHFRVDSSIDAGSMIWLQTLLSGVPFSMLIGGVVEQAIGGRSAALIGSILYTGSIALSSSVVSTSYAWLLFSFGFLPSFGSGIAYNAVLITAQRWFPSKIGMAGGIIVAGYGCGTFFIAPLQTAFVNPEHFSPNAEGLFTQSDLLDRVPNVFLAMAAFFGALQLLGVFFLASPLEELLIEDDDTVLLDSIRAPLLTRSEMVFSSSFLFLFFTLLFNGTWVQITTGLYKAYGLQFIPSDHFLSLVAAVSSIFNCGSRVFWGVLADRSSYQKTMIISSILGAIIVWCFPAVKYTGNKWLFLTMICGVFCTVGGTYSLLPFVSSRIFGKEHFGIMYGLVQLALSLAGIIAGLMGQFILPLVGYDRLFLIVGSFPIVSFILTSLLHLTPLARSCAMSRQDSFVRT